jgi:ERCC4-type nuclease
MSKRIKSAGAAQHFIALDPVVIQDTREDPACTWRFPGCEVRVATLQSGDFSLLGCEETIALERKTCADYLGSISHGRARFERELHRLRGFRFAAVLVEAPWAAIVAGDYASRMTPQAAVATTAAFMLRYGVPILFCGDKGGAERMALEFFRQWRRQCVRFAMQFVEAPGGVSVNNPNPGEEKHV